MPLYALFFVCFCWRYVCFGSRFWKQSSIGVSNICYENEIAGLDKELVQIQGRKSTLQNEVAKLNNQIKQTELTIKGLNLSVRQTEGNIALRIESIKEAEARMAKQNCLCLNI